MSEDDVLETLTGEESPVSGDTAYFEGYKQNIKVGDIVKVTRRATHRERGWKNAWNTVGMNPSIGKQLKVLQSDSGAGFLLDDGFKYPWFVLSRPHVDFLGDDK